MRQIKKYLCLLLTLILLLEYVPGSLPVAASLEDGICEIHHAVHDEATCGYVAASQGTPCNHEALCDDSCRQLTTVCIFNHVDCGCADAVPPVECGHGEEAECNYAEQIAAITCECLPGEDGTVVHAEQCDIEARKSAVICDKYVPGTDAKTCDHVCSADSGCITLVCSHKEHDELCGYVQAVEGHACNFAGKACAQCAADRGCDENCMYPEEHEGECILRCATPGCVKPQNHEDGCTMSCGCPVGETHLETCIATVEETAAAPMLGMIGSEVIAAPITIVKGEKTADMSFALSADGALLEDVIEKSTYYSNVISITRPDDQNSAVYSILGLEEGETTLTYTDANNNQYSIDIVVESRVLTATVEGSSSIEPRVNMKEGQSFNVSFKLFSGGSWQNITEGTFASSNSDVLEVIDYTNVVHVCGLNAIAEGTANVLYTNSNGVVFSLPVTIEKPLTAKVGNDTFLELNFTTGMETSLQFYLGDSATPLTGLQAAGDVITLSGGENGNYTLKANHRGSTNVIYTDETGKEYRCPVWVEDPMITEGYLHYRMSDRDYGNYPVTCIDMAVGNEMSTRFYFGDMQLSTTTPNFTWSGPIEVEDGPGGDLHIKATGIGTGYLEYLTRDSEDGPAIKNCFVINVKQNRNERPSGTRDGSYMRFGNTVIGFGRTGLGYGNVETLVLNHEVTGGFNDIYHDPFVQQAMLAAIKSDGQPDMTLLKNGIDNVKFTVLSAVYPNGTPEEEDKLQLSKENSAWVDITANVGSWENEYVAGEKVEFDAKVGVTFDLEDGDDIRRISLHTNSYVNFMGNDVRVVAYDIDSAAKLNAILYSRDALLNWIADKVENGTQHADDVGLEFAQMAYCINIILPQKDLTDAVVVSQAIGDIPFVSRPISTPDFRIRLEGQGTNKTKLAGLISKGSLFGIVNIGFEADPGVTMTRKGATFTCGILTDPEWNGNVVYDETYFNKYAQGTAVRSLKNWNNDLADWHCDIVSVNNCSFDGFDYGTYSNENGYVGSGIGNSFSNCYYGIYIDSAKKSGWVNLKSHADYSGYRFHKNVYAVRIVGLQQSMTPYDFRIHDSDFINNHIEFAIDDYTDTYLQNYYFYRNHYRGNWNGKVVGWVQHKTAPESSGNNNGSHRAPKYEVLSDGAVVSNGGNVKISGTPGKVTENNARSASEGYWIYDDANQVTRIITGEELPIAQEALTGLQKDTDVSVVNGDGSQTVAVWTFEGGE